MDLAYPVLAGFFLGWGFHQYLPELQYFAFRLRASMSGMNKRIMEAESLANLKIMASADPQTLDRAGNYVRDLAIKALKARGQANV